MDPPKAADLLTQFQEQYQMTNPNDLNRAYLIDKEFEKFTRKTIEQWNSPNDLDNAKFAKVKQEPKPVEEDSYALDLKFLNKPVTVQGVNYDSYREFINSCENYPDDSNYDSDIEYEPDDDYDAEYFSETEEEICFASTYEIRSREPEKITLEGRTFDSYNDFMDFMFTQQSDEEPDKGLESQEREEQFFAIDTELSCKEITNKEGMERGYDPNQYYAMLSGRIDFDQNIMDEHIKFGSQRDI